MDTKHEILLEQILEELRTQTEALCALQKRLDELEMAMSQHQDHAGKTVGSTDR